MAKKPKPVLKEVAEALAEAADAAEDGERTEIALAKARSKITMLERENTKLTEQVARLNTAVDLTQEDINLLTESRAVLKFTRKFKTGDLMVEYEGTAPGCDRRRRTAPDIITLMATLRGRRP